MKYICKVCLISCLFGTLCAEFIDDYLRWQVPVERPAYKDPSYYFILAAKESTVNELVTLIYEGESRTDRRAFGALANILGGDNTLLSFEEVERIFLLELLPHLMVFHLILLL